MMEIDTVDTVDTGSEECNTNKTLRARAWILTWNNFDESDIEYTKKFCKDRCKQYAFQEETGANGTKHLQIAIYLKNAISFDSLKKSFSKCHIEKAKNKEAAMKYCMKEETRTGETITNIRTIKDPLKDKELNEFQRHVINLVNKTPNDRTIHWYFDPVGGSGKTTLAKHLCIANPKETVYMTGKAADLKYGIKTFLDNPENNLKVAIFDFARTTENFISYERIEQIKNGIFYNTKYESGMIVFDTPQVIVFSNFEPKRTALSMDRWMTYQVEKGKIIETYIETDEHERDRDYV